MITTPLLISAVVREVRSAGGIVWLMQKTEGAFLLRAEKGQKQFRLVLPPVSGEPLVIPQERIVSLVVHDMPGLRTWLANLLTNQQ